MKRFFFELLRILSLLLLTAVAGLCTAWGGSQYAAIALSGGVDWQPVLWLALLTMLGVLLLIAAWRLWRGYGSGYLLALRALIGAVLLTGSDALRILFLGQPGLDMMPLLALSLLTLLIFAALRLPFIWNNIALDRIGGGRNALSRLDMLD